MPRTHDVGGKQTTKPIDVAEDETPFKADWEGRAWGINEALEGPSRLDARLVALCARTYSGAKII